MATSKDLLFVNPDNETNPFLLQTSKKNIGISACPPNIVRIEQPSVLSRVKNFLPLMAAANDRLEKDISMNTADAFDIENINEDEQHVEMNIGLYEKGDSSSGENSESDEERICKMLGEVNETNIKLTEDKQKCDAKMITEVSKIKHKTVNSKMKTRVMRRKRRKKSNKT